MSATTQKQFRSQVFPVGSFAQECSNEQIKNEPMFFNSEWQYAYDNGGPITRSFLDALPRYWHQDCVFDSRVHMLMPGWYPAIPGWHHDDVPRSPIPVGRHFITAGQPDYDAPSYRSQHILGLVNAVVAPTEFAVGNCIMPAVPEGDLIYRTWHAEVEDLIAGGRMQKVYAQDRTLYHFDCETFHTGNKAVSNGWRWFGRISKNTDRVKKITNEIRVNAQVYLEFPMEGW